MILLFVINLIYKMQKAIQDKIQLGETLNPLNDYGVFHLFMLKGL